MVTHEYLQITIKMIPIFHYQTTKITENKLLRQFILQYNPKQNKQRLCASLMYGNVYGASEIPFFCRYIKLLRWKIPSILQNYTTVKINSFMYVF